MCGGLVSNLLRLLEDGYCRGTPPRGITEAGSRARRSGRGEKARMEEVEAAVARVTSPSHSYHSLKIFTPSNSWVTVHNLKQLDGGILDPDDRLNDVADDREQIIAIYDEQTHHHHHHGGDGTSASSDSENPSPDIFQGVEHKFAPFTRNDIEITGEELSATPPPLHVRRGSEPALNRLSPSRPRPPPRPIRPRGGRPRAHHRGPECAAQLHAHENGAHKAFINSFPLPLFSFLFSLPVYLLRFPTSMSRTATAPTKTTTCPVRQPGDGAVGGRGGPSGGASEGRRRAPGRVSLVPMHSRDPSHDEAANRSVLFWRCTGSSSALSYGFLSEESHPRGPEQRPGPAGHPRDPTDVTGHDQGLLVEGVEPGGRIARDGRIEVHDRIIEINGKPLNNITFQKAQEIFKDAMLTPELRLRVVKGQRQEWYAGQAAELVEGEEKLVGGAKVASVMSTRKVPPASLSSRTQTVILQSNTRKIGRRLNGAAIEDGNLRIGDRLLEVNGVEVTGAVSRRSPPSCGRSPSEGRLRWRSLGRTSATAMRGRDGRLNAGDRKACESEAAETVGLLPPPRQSPLPPQSWTGSEREGQDELGPERLVDLGIFVKNVIHGGAASRDGRLFQNDQLVNINGMSLLGKPNSEAMKTLRTAMHQEGPTPGSSHLRWPGGSTTRRGRAPHPTTGQVGRAPTASSPTRLHRDPGRCQVIARNTDPDHSVAAAGDAWRKGVCGGGRARPQPLGSPTVNLPSRDTLIIHDDAGNHMSREICRSDGPGPPEATVTTQTSLEENAAGFSRDQFGRQSMSEKRHATLDAKNTDTYQRNKKAREEREKQRQMMLAQEKLAASQGMGMGLAAMEGETREEFKPGSREVGIDLPTQDHPSLKAKQPEPSKKSSLKTSQQSSVLKNHHATLEIPRPILKPSPKLRQKANTLVSASPKAKSKQQYARKGGSETLDRTVGRGSLKGHWSGYPRGPFSPITRSLERNHSKGNQRTTFGQDLSAMISNWDALRSRLDVGPGLGMKKSSSLESLQTMVQEMALEEEGHRMGSGRVPRGRGCNESFGLLLTGLMMSLSPV
ncbi:hypothetical protein C7M84_025461 [Penaeus vannamei]|uniref:PDZ domain-containing protein n=1 Tax=Penaeus vannamei TaxID=6689 RepID=A0A423TYB6_PENVA|nr:hypothetical protein C7M84_025461 [Penaeus vannamei]